MAYRIKELKPYKGYNIFRADKCRIDPFGRHIMYVVYMVSNSRGFIGGDHGTIKEAHKFIDWLIKENEV